NGLESITQATNAFNAGLLGLAPQNGDNPNAPSAYLNYILFDTNYARVAAGAVQVPQAAGFEEPQRGNGYTSANLLKFAETIDIAQAGYIYIWVSNESENTEVWFDDLNVVHQSTLVAQATDYETWGGVLREQKWEDLEGKYRYGYQGKYAERDEETGWNHFELREYDPVIGRWLQYDPKGQFYSPYVGMGNNPVSGTDPDGGYSFFGALWRATLYGGSLPKKVFSSAGKYEWAYTSLRGNLELGGGKWESDPILYKASKDLYDQAMAKYKWPGTAEPVQFEFQVALAVTTAGIGNAARAAGGTLVLGSDAATLANASRIVVENGIEQVLAHGTADVLIIDGVKMSAKELARMMLKNGFEKGTPVRLISCHTGIAGDGFAYQLSRYLKSPVLAPTNKVGVLRDGAYIIDGAGVWRTFYNTTITK
ncbi:MAG: RHS repeat-associated core domain-containing protein, partial [Flammeovirgaceae bacterium]